MTLTLNVDFGGALTLGAKLKKLEGFKRGLYAAGLYLEGKLRVYPPTRRRRQPFKTAKSRRFFFAALSAGEIDVPYRRGLSPGSETAGKRWTVERRTSGMTVVVGNNASYAPLLWDSKRQVAYHKGNWTPYQTVLKREGAELRRIVTAEIKKEL